MDASWIKYSEALPFQFSDGGRADTGYKGRTGDCLCRAAAIASGRPYQEIYDLVNQFGDRERRTKRRKDGRSSARTGVYRATAARIFTELGFAWVPTMGIGTGCRVHMRAGELPSKGRLIVSLSKHYTAVIDGVVYDTYNPCRGGNRCVYGYWIKG